MSSKSISPNHREIISARSTITGQQEYLTSTSNILNVNASISGTVTITNASIKVDDTAFTPAVDSVTMIGATFDDTSPDSVNEGDAGAVRMSANRNQYVQIRDNAGNERGLNIDASGRLTALAVQSGTWNIASITTGVVAGTTATALGKARDGVAGATDTGVASLHIRRDTPTALTPIAGDYELAQISSVGEQWVREYPATTPTVTSVNDSASNQTLLSSSTTRKGFRLYNDSTQIAYVKYGATATSTDFTVKIFPESLHYEDNYNGNVDCIWAADGSGAMKVTSLA